MVWGFFDWRYPDLFGGERVAALECHSLPIRRERSRRPDFLGCLLRLPRSIRTNPVEARIGLVPNRKENVLTIRGPDRRLTRARKRREARYCVAFEVLDPKVPAPESVVAGCKDQALAIRREAHAVVESGRRMQWLCLAGVIQPEDRSRRFPLAADIYKRSIS